MLVQMGVFWVHFHAQGVSDGTRPQHENVGRRSKRRSNGAQRKLSSGPALGRDGFVQIGAAYGV